MGEGPTGIVLDEARARAYNLNKFEGSISTIDLGDDKEVARANFFDPTPMAIKAGRVHLYNTHLGSGTGHISCASCHVDGKWDRLAWDLGDPSGEMDTVPGQFGDVVFHPLKGLKTTQSLVDIINRGTGNLHWRGDKGGLIDFAGAFQHLQGLSAPMDAGSMQEMEDLLANTWYVPNPFRTYRPENGSAAARERIVSPNRVRYHQTTFQSVQSAGVALFVAVNQNCAHCHVGNTGRGDLPGQGNTGGTPGVDMNLNENMAADLRATYRKIGFFYDGPSTAGFGLMADGAFPTNFNRETTSNDYFGDYENELLSWSGGIYVPNCQPCDDFGLWHPHHDAGPALGHRRTLNGTIGSTADITFMKALVDDKDQEYGLIVKGIYQGEQRGFVYTGSDTYQSDQAGQTVTHGQLVSAAQNNNEPLSWTIVHPSTATRLGVDADSDGVYDQDDKVAMVNVRLMLEGPLDGTRMRSDLAAAGYLPTTDPYGLGTEMSPFVLEQEGGSAPVDWVVVELRDEADPTLVLGSQAAVVLASGNVVAATGEQTLAFPALGPGDYQVAVWHRNHLGAMTFDAITLDGGMDAVVDFTDPGT
ncbi:MAG: hypothetical protein KDC03_21160, partial [Flavobacteriales bacterium]|nr:hypothetical protein [Flavobacteriales bacterium]